ncbi:MAG: HisA/HisF family protein [Methanosphaera sp.]|nr:HisA/HisF family protein [Methanosphaera sp.]
MIIPVIDLMNGDCVSGKSGNRSTYTHLESVYGDCPLDVAHNLREDGARALYVADLDRIEKVGDNSDIISQINSVIPVVLDNGISTISDIEYDENICSYYILATETMKSMDSVKQILKKTPSKRIVISIDIKNNQLLIANNEIKLDDIISLINIYKPRAIIILNISQVGTKQQDNNELLYKIIEKTPHTPHYIAGGITNESISDYKRDNIDNFLIGTILHEGKLENKL